MNVDIRAPPGLPVSRVFQAPQERKVQRATQVLRVSQGKTAQQDYGASQVNEVFLELRAPLD